ncbi:MAG TPA: OmpA family protein [Thermohalobaculum sp.]|nr:OmpA family protein [Thermohalobaculum sp.]
MRRAMSLILAAALAGGAAAAQEEPEVPDPGAPLGAVPTAHVDRPFDRYALPVAPFGGDDAALDEVEGRVIWTGYRLDDPEASAAEVMAGYRGRLEALGFTPMLDCADAACGGFDFRFGVQLLPAPAMLLDAADFRQLSARREGESDKPTFASVLVSRVLSAIHVQTVLVLPAEAARGAAPLEDLAAAAAPRILPQDEAVLKERLTAQGHVSVRGLAFETGGAALSAESAPALEVTAKLLQANPEMSILIVGHSDNTGALEANIDLSRRRAEAVRTALIGLGVAPGRLEAHGAGFLAPVTTNTTPEGRAMNRRVELVLR